MQKKRASGREENESEALRESASWLRLIMENTTDGINIAEYDPQTGKRRLVMCNDRYVEMSGRSREELMEAEDLDKFVVWTIYLGRTCFEQLLKGLPSEGTSSWMRPDGRENYYEWTAAPLKVGDKYHIIGIDRDVTERKKAEERLRRLAMISEQVGEGVAMADLDGVLQFVNAAWAGMHGYETGRELVGKHLSVFHTPEQMKTDVIPFNKEVKRKGRHKGQVRHVRRDGTPFPTDMTVNLFKDEGGNPIGLAAFMIDITERKQTEEALQESEFQYRTTLNSMGDAIHVVDKDLRIVLCNPALEQWCAQLDLVSKPIGLSVFEAFPFLPTEVRDEYHHVFQTGEALVREETFTVGNEELSAETRKIPIIEKGKVVQIVTVIRDITESKRAEEALARSEEKFRTLVEQLPVVTYAAVLDKTSTTTYVSPQVESFLGVSPDVYLKTPDFWSDHLHPDDRQRVLSEVAKCHETGEPFRSEYRMVSQSGDVIWIRDEAVIARDADGTPLFLQGVMLNVTERKQAEQELRESEKTMRAILNATLDSVLLIEPDGTILAVNDIAATRGFGKDPSELIGKNVRDTLRSDLAQHRLAQSDKVVRSGKPLRFEDERDGVWLDHSVNPIFDSEGRVARLAIFARDITESKKVEEALRESEKTMRVILNATLDSVLTIEPNGTILVVNDMAARGFGKSASELIGMNVRDTLRSDLAQHRLDQSDKVVRSGRPLRFEDEHDGMWLDHSVYPVFDSEGRVARLAIYARDITERKKAEEALRESEETARALLNATQDLALMIDPDGTLLAVNDIAAAKEFGKTSSELIGKNVRDTDKSNLVEHRLTQSNEVVRSGKPLRFEDEHDGVWLDHSVYPIFDSEGRVVRLAIYARDITESKKAEEALRNSERDLRNRVRELNCLYQVTEVVNTRGDSLDAMLQGITDILPESCQYPEKACARIAFGEKEYATDNFRKSPWKLAADIMVVGEKVGFVEVFSLEEKPAAGEGPFLKEERSLIDTVAARIGRNIERIQNRQRLLVEQSALHEKNIALREVMDGIQDEKKEFGRRIVSNVEKIIMPLLYALERELPQGQRKYVDLLKGGLEDITLPFADRLSRQFASLTPTEIRICNLIRRGLLTKEIAQMQHVSPATVNKHREHIRQKLLIKNKGVNLATYLENYMSGHAGS